MRRAILWLLCGLTLLFPAYAVQTPINAVQTPISAVQTPAEDGERAVYFSHANGEKRIALTFDDGPHYRYTGEILSILEEYGIRATFFVVGELAERYPELIEKELALGHEIGNHTWSHPHMKTLDAEHTREELLRTEAALDAIADYRPKLFRPPEGFFPEAVEKAARSLGYSLILWSVDTRDWAHTPPCEIAENVLAGVDSGSIILFHDFIGRDSPTPEALRLILPKLIDEGYSFVTVSELLAS